MKEKSKDRGCDSPSFVLELVYHWCTCTCAPLVYMYLCSTGVHVLDDSPMQINWQPLLTLALSDHGDDEEEDIEVTLEEMYKYVDEFPELLEPIIELQKRIRKKCLGISYWKKAMKRRVKMFGNENMDKILFEKSTIFSKPIANIQKGRLLVIKKCEKDWCKIETKSLKGWVDKKNLWGATN